MSDIVAIGHSERVETASMSVSESGKAIITVEFYNGDEKTMAMERTKAEALVEMIEDQYSRFDRKTDSDQSVNGGTMT